MTNGWHRYNMTVSRVRNHLRDSANEPLWLGEIPFLNTQVGKMETTADALGIFGNQQSAPLTRVTAQQNAAETAVEEAAHPLS